MTGSGRLTVYRSLGLLSGAALTAWMAFPVFLDKGSLVVTGAVPLLAVLMVVAFILVYPAENGQRARWLSWPVQAAFFCGLGAEVQLGFGGSQLSVLIFFVVYPLSVFARRRSLMWLPAFFLLLPGVGRYIATEDWQLLAWGAGFSVFSVVTGLILSREDIRYRRLQEEVRQHREDALEIMNRVSETGAGQPVHYSREEMARFVTHMEDRFLHDLLIWGCRVFKARTGVLLVPHGPGFFKIRAGATLVKDGLVEEPFPSEKGFIHIARQRDGVLCLADARSSTHASSLYSNADTGVGSIVVKVIYRGEAERERSGSDEQTVHSVLYFDHEEVDAFIMDDGLEKWLTQYANLIIRAMGMVDMLQRLGSQMTSKEALAVYTGRLTTTLEPEKIAGIAVDAVMESIPRCTGAAVFTYEKNSLTLLKARGGGLGSLGAIKILREESSQLGLLLRRMQEMRDAGNGAADGKTGERRIEIFLHHRQAKPSPFFHKREKVESIASFAALPSMMRRGDGTLELKAVLAAVSPEQDVFGNEEMEDLRMVANVMSPALDNAGYHIKVREMSRIDGLTGLYNHRVFQETLDHRFQRLKRDYDRSFAVIMVDGDKFKDVNDRYGHPVGDEVLREIARRLRGGVRSLDTVARYGGEEFAIILDEVSEKEVRKVTEKLRDSIASEPFKTSAGRLKISASFGYCLNRAGERLQKQEMLERADKALYRAKADGRNRVVGYRDIADDDKADEPLDEAARQGG